MQRFRSNAAMLFYFLRGSKKYYFLTFLFVILTSILDLFNPRIIGFTVDSVIGSKEPELPVLFSGLLRDFGGVDFLKKHLVGIAILVIILASLAAFTRIFYRINIAKGTERFVETLRNELYSHIIRLPYAWHKKHATGDIIQRCTSDVDTVKTFLSEQLVNLVRITVLITLSIFFMLQVNGKLTFIAAIFIPIIVLYSVFFHTKIAKTFENVDVQEGKLSTIVQENLTGIRVVRAFGRESFERERFERQNEIYFSSDLHLCRYLSAFWISGDLITGLQILSVLTFGVVLCLRGELSVGGYIAFFAYNSMMVWPVRMIGRVIAEMSKSGVSFERIRYMMNAEEEPGETGEKIPFEGKDIVFDHVSFTYPDHENTTSHEETGSDAEVLHEISFTVKGGSTLGILGGTGSGKSTLMLLLDRLYDLPEGSGQIRIGGTDIRSISRSYLRKNIGMVLQEPYLFSRTLAQNISISRREAKADEIQRVSRIASLEDAIAHFNDGYETFVGERGVTLSGGQKQRTAIAQMLIRKPPIMIFDDSLSAVDAQTDEKIRRALSGEIQSATVILIAHRISTLMQADHIIVLDHGRIAEEGTHADLIQKNGIYSKIYHLQAGISADTEER